ncbi:MAG: PfkB family carbohydrate kinase [Candidatus Omnitrophota bacterium]
MKRDSYSKIKTIETLGEICAQLRRKGKKIVLCHGVFDLLHPGHIKYFEAARKKGDVLIVTVTRDEYVNKGPGRPIFTHALRAESIAAIECVDYVAVNEWPTAVETIKKLKPHWYVKGRDYADKSADLTGKIHDEERAIRSIGGDIHFVDEATYSSSSLINTYLAPYPAEAKDFFAKFKKNHDAASITNILKSVNDIKVLVIGDIIIDEYHYCVGVGKAQKDNIIATKFLNEEVFAGGVLAAANHLAGFCKDVTLVSCVGGKNNYRDLIARRLKANIKTKFYNLPDAHTVVKRRFLDPNFLHKLFEICYLEEPGMMPAVIEKKICTYLEAHLKDFDMVLVADFGHGMITPRMVKLLTQKAKFLSVNVQTNSANLGFNLITKFPRADYICIDEPELRLACHDRVGKLEGLITGISSKLSCERIIITRGHRGSLAYSRKEGFSHIPVFSTQIVDRIGAGDAYFSVTSPCVFKKTAMETVGFIGNAVGATKVLIVGNRSSVEPIPLTKYIVTLLR